MEFKQQFRAARKAATPLVAVRTADPWSAINEITEPLNGNINQAPFLIWDLMRGLQGLNKPGSEVAARLLDGGDPLEVSTRPTDFLMLLGKISTEDVIIVMVNAHMFWTNEGVKQGIWNLRESFKMKGQMLVMTTTAGSVLPPELSEDVLVIDEPLPTPEELLVILRNIVQAAGCPALTAEQEAAAIDAVAGLAAFPAEQAMAMSASKKGIDVEGLWERKRQQIEQQAGMTVSRGSTPEPVGLENVRAFLKQVLAGRKKYRCILFIDEIEKAFAGTGTDLSGVKTGMTGTWLSWTTERESDGMLCIGVPGGGKTLLAKWAGSVAGIPTIMFDLAGMQSGIIGSTEERLRTALKTVDAISQGNTLVIGTCNAIGQMPPEILSRFTLGTFFFDLMGADEREACWKFYGKKYSLSAGDPVPDDDGWTGREIKECSKLADQLQIPLRQAAAFIVPVCRAAADKVRSLRQLATGKYVSASEPGIYRWEEQAESSGGGKRRLQLDDGPLAFDRKGGKV
jgi:hypothetical protein